MWANKSTQNRQTDTINISGLVAENFHIKLSYLVVVHKVVDTNLALVVIHVKLDVLVHFPFLIREGCHSLPDPRNQNISTGADQCICGVEVKQFSMDFTTFTEVRAQLHNTAAKMGVQCLTQRHLSREYGWTTKSIPYYMVFILYYTVLCLFQT